MEPGGGVRHRSGFLPRLRAGARGLDARFPESCAPVAATTIITNSIGVSIMAFAFGLTAGVGTS
jgi:uncharacterized membrane protein SpoIIM required for sporulation